LLVSSIILTSSMSPIKQADLILIRIRKKQCLHIVVYSNGCAMIIIIIRHWYYYL